MHYSIQTLSQLRPILQGFRKSRGLTQANMAAYLGVRQQTYAELEANPAAASVERLFKALRVLGVEMVLSPAPEIAMQPEPEPPSGTVTPPEEDPRRVTQVEQPKMPVKRKASRTAGKTGQPPREDW
ncbi:MULTISPECIES: helix-turn-helix transcriptional regulator [unclassified Cupriavidus]|uniref:helix-turn-helix domain-containing protein n=1 Tax=unclassified Cupriavidus TaxID=2640874 RepID=UPI001AE80860|nr:MULTISPECIES: helix-turn-helix transcriptional regulator [unclassified Cupriavidus]MBP0630332.1 helix-turn-helix transcriptional regulator [Cupriavidus sp. AcVe19-1a]MBP0634023.1 helix-turn-helix transcriptional regulator [Cupriavidus sp. AcVe19-6a]